MSTMRMTVKKFTQCILLTTVLISYGLLLAYDRQHIAKSSNVVSSSDDAQHQFQSERSPRSLNAKSRAILSSSDTTSQFETSNHHTNNPLHDSLNDIFISVKTTKKFHRSRLDVIARTWFVLARDQVSLYL